MTLAMHSSSVDEAGAIVNPGPAAGFIIGMDGVTVYHAGDTALFSDMKLMGISTTRMWHSSRLGGGTRWESRKQ